MGTPVSFTNWLWYRCIRPKLEETKSKLPEIDISNFGIDDVEEIMGEFMPAIKVEKDKKDKKKNKKDQVVLNAKEKLQVQNLIKNMIFGDLGKGQTSGSSVKGWVNMIDVKDMPTLVPW